MAAAAILTRKEETLGMLDSLGHANGPTNDKNGIERQRLFQRPPVNLHPKVGEESDYIRSLPEVVDFNAKHNPDHLFCIQARKQAEHASFSSLLITHLQFKEAVSQCALWLKQNVKELRLPVTGEDGAAVKGPPIALFMESDIGLWIHKLALMGLGVPILLLSARLSSTAIIHLLDKTSATAIVVSPRLRVTALEADSTAGTSHQPATLYTAAGFDAFVHRDGSASAEPVCQENHYLNEFDRDVLILHSSGTTGLPKPIYVSHRHLVCFLTCHSFVNAAEAQGRNVSTLPLYHGFGLVAPTLAMGVGKTICLQAPSTIPNASSTIGLLNAVNAASLMSVPSILEDISLMPGAKGAKALAGLDFVTFGGGVLKPSVGTRLSANGVRILNHYGTTESGPLSPIFVPKADYDWRYFRLRQDMKLKLEEIASQGGERRFKLTTYPFGWRVPFEIQDQLICNPLRPDTDFNAVGRNDDLIVLATGEKVQPQILENLLSSSGLVKSAIAFGDNQFEIGIIVEPAEAPAVGTGASFKESIWPTIVKAGSLMDDFAKISTLEAIIIVPAGTKVPRTDKGTIARREVYKLFESEIAQAYYNIENFVMDATIPPLRMDAPERGIKELIQTRLSWKIPSDQWGFDDDLFELGMDSLQAARLRRHLLSAVPCEEGVTTEPSITRDFVYLHPSVSRMANALCNVKPTENGTLQLTAEVDQYLEHYALPPKSLQLKETRKNVVLMTGGTGSLGAHCLTQLARQVNVDQVICLNRPSRGDASVHAGKLRQKASLKAKGIHIGADEWAKIHVLQTNTAQPMLGLTEAEYDKLRGSVTHIFHNAWPMDFKLQLSSFKAQFQILRNLLALATDVHRARPVVKPRLLFVSSVATIGRYADVCGGRIVPEEPVDSLDCVNSIGYAQAKLVCERMVERAVQDYGEELEASSVRFGQLSGSTCTGFWNVDEHFPALIKSSQRIKALPQLPGTFTWIPVDDAAAVVSELLLATSRPSLVYQIENPVRQSWSDALSTIGADLDIAKSLPLETWLDEVCRAVDASSEANPAKKLEDFFRLDFQRMACGQVIMGTDITRKESATLRTMDAVPAEVISSHLRYWRSIKFLD